MKASGPGILDQQNQKNIRRGIWAADPVADRWEMLTGTPHTNTRKPEMQSRASGQREDPNNFRLARC